MYSNEESDAESSPKSVKQRYSAVKLAPLQEKSSASVDSSKTSAPRTTTLRVVPDDNKETKEDEDNSRHENSFKPLDSSFKKLSIESAHIQKPKIISSKSPQQQQLSVPMLKSPQQRSAQLPTISNQSLQQSTSSEQVSQPGPKKRQQTPAVQQKIRRPSRDQDHLSIACHLFPRLSETNLNFHDIYWNIEPRSGKVFLRKRMVNVNKLFGFHSLQSLRRQEISISADEMANLKLRLYLVDLRPQAAQQIVSNIAEVPIAMQQSRLAGFICQKSSTKPMLVRSNYKQSEVVLRVELLLLFTKHSFVDIPLLNSEQRSQLSSRTQTLIVGDYKLLFDSWDPPARLAVKTDCLPDILICPEEWVQMLATFRQLSAEVLVEREQKQHTTWITDLVMATFPSVCELPRLAEIFLYVLNKKQKYDTKVFRQVFMQYIFPVVHTISLQSNKHANDIRLELEKSDGSPLKFLAEERSKPLHVVHYATHLSGYHAID